MNNSSKLLLVTAFAAMAAVAAESVNDWENPEVNSSNRLPPRTYSMPLKSVSAALTGSLEPDTPYKLSLNGDWKFSWAGDPALRVRNFHEVGFSDADWGEIDVPSCVECRGYGTPGYTNVRYPTANTTHPTDKEFAKVLDRDTRKGNYNPVSSYRTRFTVPAEWKGRDVILRFDGVYSAYYVWVNGEKVGYAEDSKLPSEFDITRFVKDGENLLAVEVYRWCDGSFLEDQDMFRFSGIYRDVTLWAKPKGGIWDFQVKTELKNDYRDATIAVAGCDLADCELFDAEGKSVGKFAAGLAPLELKGVALWSAEKPNLYTLVVKRGDDIRARKVGFKEQKIVGNTFLVNGRPVKFKGVDRHECSAENGRSVSVEEMVRDLTLMKRYNVNTVRTSHYPDHHLWYDLCDRWGIYLVAEANVEAHEPGYDDRGLGCLQPWYKSIVERNERHVQFYRNHPSVTMWSLGNETGHGDGFRQAVAAVRAADPTRPVHWERGNEDVDVDSTMYSTVEWLEKRGKLGDAKAGSLDSAAGGEGFAISGHTAGKCFFMCEYAHAMGNAVGNFAEYWDVYYAHPSLCGGCIWDWVDQSLWKYTDRVDPKTGRRERFLAYGGDWDEEPNDGPFCCNGVIHGDRQVTAKLVEVGHVHRNLVVTRSQAQGDNRFASVFELWNRHLFTSADEFSAVWKLRENGVVVKTGGFEPPALEPLSRCRFTVSGLAEALAATRPGAELLVDFEFATKRDYPWAKAGWVVARDQVALSKLDWCERNFPNAAGAEAKIEAGDDKVLKVMAGNTLAVFCRKSGTLCELLMNGKTILKDPVPGVVTGPRFTCERAFTDNDRWMRDGNSWCEDRRSLDGFYSNGFYSKGLSQLSYHARPIRIDGNRVKVTVEVTGQKSAGFTHESVYTFRADGSVEIANAVTPHGYMPSVLPRIGLSWQLDRSLEQMSYYGRGPRENYVDRKTGSFLGVWNSTVTEQYEDYVRPQDNGYKCDVRWVAFTDKAGRGIRFSGSEPLFVQALHYGLEDLEFARHRNGQKRFRTPLKARNEVMLNLDVRQTGLGGASCGPGPMEKYRYRPTEPVRWSLRLDPVKPAAK